MQFKSETIQDGVAERAFDLTVDGERVPGLLWAPEGAKGPRPLVLMGHGGTQHKRIPAFVARAGSYVRKFGYAVAAIDAPGHGERVSKEEREQTQRDTQARRAQGLPPFDAERSKQMAERNKRGVPEWNATLDALQSLDFIGDKGPVGYWGVSMGTAIGLPFVAQQKRITAAIFGLAGLRPGAAEFEAAAKSLTIPLLYVIQWEDDLVTHDAAIALYNAFGSKEKTMHINPGPHVGIPQFEGRDWENFYTRHLGTAEKPAKIAA